MTGAVGAAEAASARLWRERRRRAALLDCCHPVLMSIELREFAFVVLYILELLSGIDDVLAALVELFFRYELLV